MCGRVCVCRCVGVGMSVCASVWLWTCLCVQVCGCVGVSAGVWVWVCLCRYMCVFAYVQCVGRFEPYIIIRECGSTLYVGMAQGVSLSLYIGIGAKFENTQKTGERRLRTAEYRTVLL